MAIETAAMSAANRRPAARYQALSSGRPQDPTLQEQAMGVAKKKAMEKGEEFAMPMLENVFGNIKTAFTGASTAAPVAEGVVTQAATGAAGTGAMAGLGAAVPYIGAAMLAGKAFGLFNQGGYVNGPLSKVRYKQSGGPVNEEIEVSYGGPLSKGV